MDTNLTLMTLKDICFPDGFVIKEKAIYNTGQKYYIGPDKYKYIINDDKNHQIDPESVIELGFITAEAFKQIDDIRKSGGTGGDISEVLSTIATMQSTIDLLTDQNELTKEQIDDLNKKYNGIVQFGTFWEEVDKNVNVW